MYPLNCVYNAHGTLKTLDLWDRLDVANVDGGAEGATDVHGNDGSAAPRFSVQIGHDDGGGDGA